jgi:malonyl-CoA/methylmalonyl-CoA synthetase
MPPASTLSIAHNLYATLRSQFPADLAGVAVESIAADAAHSASYSWSDLERGSAMIANLLVSLDLPAGARVAMQVEKSVEALMLYLATLRAGLVFVPLNTAYQLDEMRYFIGDAQPSVVVCTPGNFGWVSKLAFSAGCGHVFTLDEDRTGSLLQRAAHHGDRHMPVRSAEDDVAVILYTSGTTGRSKGALLSHGNMRSNALTLKSYWGWQQGDVLIHALPIFHIHGLFVACHGALINGSRMLWLPRFDPATVIGLLPRATVFMGVPTLYVRLLGQPSLNAAACAHMRLFISGSAPLLTDTFRRFAEVTGHTILERYGMSETVMITSNPYRAEDGERRGGTVGFALPQVEVRVAGDGAIGDIQVRGPNVFKGYWRNPEKTAEAFTPEGWFMTGDVGAFDADGYLRIVGRSKDLVITGGYNVYPAEVESLINDLPGVAESAVIGVPHADFGEAVVAVVIPRPGAILDPAEIIAICKARIANFKVPKRVVIADDLPRNAMGKVQKNLLRERFAS